jgi:hypothetical protein
VLVRRALLLVLATTYLVYVFRVPSGEWQRMGLGDWIDPYFINSLLEQWRFSLTHFRSPASPPMFFPARGTLGYSHTLLFYAPVYVVARVWLHPFTAYAVTLFAIIEFGTLCLYGVFRRFMRLDFLESLVLTAMFATSRNVINGSTGVWSQRASIFLVPPILFLGLTVARWRPGLSRWAGLACTALLATSLFTHDIYTGLLSAVVAMLLAIGAGAILGWPRTGVRITLWRTRPQVLTARRRALAYAALAAVAVSLAIAAQHEFGNVRHRHPGRAFAAAALAAIAFELLRGGTAQRLAVVNRTRAADAAALSLGALAGLVIFTSMYGGAFSQHHSFPAQELQQHLTLVRFTGLRQLLTSPGSLVAFDAGRSLTIVFVLALAAWVPPWRAAPAVRALSLWFVVVTLVVMAIPIRVGDFAPWQYPFDWIPGFSAIRDPRRIQYPFELAAALASGLSIAQLPGSSATRRVLTFFVLAVLLVKWNPERFDYERPRDVFDRWVEAPIRIDATCDSFFVKPASASYASRSPNVWALYSNDAAFIATAHAIPTLNGYSAWTPPDWHLFNPQDADYMPGVQRWISLNQLDHVCALDIEQRTMAPR